MKAVATAVQSDGLFPYILWNEASRSEQTRVPFGLGSGCGYCLCGRVPIWSLSPLSVILITQFCPSAGNIGLGTACGKMFRASVVTVLDEGDSDILRTGEAAA